MTGSKPVALPLGYAPKIPGSRCACDINGIADLCKPAVAKRRDSPHTWAAHTETANMTDIKPDLPWSIKGVTADARARAKAAAKRDGLTMGAWLSQAIESGDGAPPAADVGAPVAPADIEARLDALEARMVALAAPLHEVIAQLSGRLSQLEDRLAAAEAPSPPPDTATEE